VDLVGRPTYSYHSSFAFYRDNVFASLCFPHKAEGVPTGLKSARLVEGRLSRAQKPVEEGSYHLHMEKLKCSNPVILGHSAVFYPHCLHPLDHIIAALCIHLTRSLGSIELSLTLDVFLRQINL
jgi:hypothetical protein